MITALNEMIKKYPYTIVAMIYMFLFSVNLKVNNLNPFYMLQSLAVRQPVDDNHLAYNLIAVCIVLAIGFSFGWWARHRMDKAMEQPPIIKQSPDQFDFEEWQAFSDQ